MGYKENILLGGAMLLFGVTAFIVGKREQKQEQATGNNTTGNNTINNSTMNNSSLPRGYRNNNPLNLRINKNNNWLGKVANNTDGAFEQFTSMAYGYRAAFIVIRNYINKYGLNTVSKIISKWAPAVENNTTGYIQRVCSISGLSASTVVNPTDKTTMTKLVYAMSIVENGNTPQPDEDAITSGWNLYTSTL